MPDFFRKGLRSMKACELQNSPTLSVVNDDTTSGALDPPARSAWLILSSVMLPTGFTWMLGCAFSKASMVAWIAATSLGALQPCQNVIVTSAFGSSVDPPCGLPVQAASSDAAATAAVAARIFVRCAMGASPFGSGGGAGRRGEGVEDEVARGLQRGVQG